MLRSYKTRGRRSSVRGCPGDPITSNSGASPWGWGESPVWQRAWRRSNRLSQDCLLGILDARCVRVDVAELHCLWETVTDGIGRQRAARGGTAVEVTWSRPSAVHLPNLDAAETPVERFSPIRRIVHRLQLVQPWRRFRSLRCPLSSESTTSRNARITNKRSNVLRWIRAARCILSRR